MNEELPELPKLLILHDSYLNGEAKLFLDHFSEVTLIHRGNVKGPHVYEAYLELLRPDIVIFENPERSLQRFAFTEED